MTERPRRSALYLPASNAKALAKARLLPCDVIILDLEDAVAPDAKALARDQAIAAVREGGFGTRELIVRVNALTTEWGADDLAAVSSVRPDAVLVPKIDGDGDVAAYAKQLSGGMPIWAMIETAQSMFHLEAIATAPQMAGLVMGTNDLAKEMGARLTVGREPFWGMLAMTVAAARVGGLAILDGVYNVIDDLEGFTLQCMQAVNFGFDGKTLIHPKQIDICNAAFTPDEAEVAWARAIVAAFAEPENQAKGAIRVEGRMVELLHLEQARKTLGRSPGTLR
jgi:citrate lyase subunit beta / citryl-CoA lyase